MAWRCGLSVSSFAIAVCPSSAHVMAFSKNNSSSCLAFALARRAATRRMALARNLLVNALACSGSVGILAGLISFSGGSAAKAGSVA
eukprot:scaffold47031_cov36-Cyclotella_meneghiniana.AAC.1